MQIIKPREELHPYVRYYWILESDEPFSVLTFPIGCSQIIFHKGTPLYIPELDKSQSHITISGQVNFPSHIQSAGRLEMIVAVFYPHIIGIFIDTPPSAFYNLEVSGYDIESRQLNEIAQRIFDSESHEECIAILETFLLSKIRYSLNIRRIGESVNTLLRAPYTKVDTLAADACLSKRQYERVFCETVGMNPKEYARIVRFQKALWLMQQGECCNAGIAAECGFSDQSHFIKDFRKLSGHTPDLLRRYCTPYSDLFTNPS
ncbi:AraC family transcriptional regulator [Muribaculum sp.]|uniref:helix-turn-helix domain-containing protein n=1 Tax=Muribaculum sp. TaxID=1918611 RepID=UPI0023BF6EBE|nr:helix-turn-helix domain-containing protein [Muribaculum sp.]MDE5706106.1 helix-turn-helix domain-containing protein [Muribaculum sp.]